MLSINNVTKTVKLVEDRIRSGSPRKETSAEPVRREVLVDLVPQFPLAAKRPTPDRMLGDKPGPALDLVEPA